MPAHTVKTTGTCLARSFAAYGRHICKCINPTRSRPDSRSPLAPYLLTASSSERMDGSPRTPRVFSSEKPLLAHVCSISLLVLTWTLVLSKVGLYPVPLFAFHPLLVSLGLYLLFQGIVALQKARGQDEKARGLLRHKILLGVLGVPLVTVGVYVMWHLHDKPGAKHFISWHGVIGLLLLLAFWVQGLFGVAFVYSPRFFFGTEARAKAMYKYHRYVLARITYATRLCGYVLGTLILLELLLAIWEVRWVQTVTHLSHRVVATGLVLALGFGVFQHVDGAKLGW